MIVRFWKLHVRFCATWPLCAPVRFAETVHQPRLFASEIFKGSRIACNGI